MRYASVYPLVTTRALARPFTYEVEEGVGKGAVVSIPLGRSRVRGVVVAEESSAPELPPVSRPVTRTRPLAVAGPGENQMQVRAAPANPVHPDTGVNVAPPSAEKDTSNAANVPLSDAVHCTVSGTPV